MSEEQASEENGPAETRPDEQVVGEDESGYGGAGVDEVKPGNQSHPGNGQNRPPSEQDEDQAI